MLTTKYYIAQILMVKSYGFFYIKFISIFPSRFVPCGNVVTSEQVTARVLQVRHGVAMALREVIKLHGNTAGISVHTPPNKVSDVLY